MGADQPDLQNLEERLMKKLVLGVLAAGAMAISGPAFANYDLGAACTEAVAADDSIPAEAKTAGCSCMVENTTPEITASFEAADGTENPAEHWSEGAQALVAQCFPQPAE